MITNLEHQMIGYIEKENETVYQWVRQFNIATKNDNGQGPADMEIKGPVGIKRSPQASD